MSVANATLLRAVYNITRPGYPPENAAEIVAEAHRIAGSSMEARVAAGIAAVQEEFDERGLGDASLLVRVILDAADEVET